MPNVNNRVPSSSLHHDSDKNNMDLGWCILNNLQQPELLPVLKPPSDDSSSSPILEHPCIYRIQTHPPAGGEENLTGIEDVMMSPTDRMDSPIRSSVLHLIEALMSGAESDVGHAAADFLQAAIRSWEVVRSVHESGLGRILLRAASSAVAYIISSSSFSRRTIPISSVQKVQPEDGQHGYLKECLKWLRMCSDEFEARPDDMEAITLSLCPVRCAPILLRVIIVSA